MASLARRSATVFRARGTCAADQRSNPASVCRAADHNGMSLASLTRHRPASCSTISFGVEQEGHLAGAELRRQLEGADDARVLGDVVGLDPEVVRDGRVRDRAVIAGIGPAQIEQRGARATPAPGSRGPRHRSG